MAKTALIEERANAPRPLHRAPEPHPERQPMPPPERFPVEADATAKGAEPPAVQEQFDKAAELAPQPVLSRAEQIKCDMAEWRRKNDGREM